MSDKLNVAGEDVPIDKLVPINERSINLKTNKGFRKILSSIKNIGLIEPLCVYRENGHYLILDGFLRYKALQQIGIKMVPCILQQTKEAYTFNRMVNVLSPYQESRMLRKSLASIDHSTIEQVLGLKSLEYRLGTQTYEHLDNNIIKMIDANKISRKCAKELTYVNRERQLEILQEMKKYNDFSITFARALVIKTSPDKRNVEKKVRKTWFEDSGKKQELIAKLEEVQKRYDFFSTLYRQYMTDLLKLSIYVRKLITNEKIKNYLAQKFPDLFENFNKIVFENDDRKAVKMAV